MVGYLLGSSYALFMVSGGWGCLAMSVFTCFTTVVLYGKENMQFFQCRPSGLFDSMVSVFRLLMLSFNGVRQSLATGYRQPFNTLAFDISILVVFPPYMFTSSPS